MIMNFKLAEESFTIDRYSQNYGIVVYDICSILFGINNILLTYYNSSCRRLTSAISNELRMPQHLST